MSERGGGRRAASGYGGGRFGGRAGGDYGGRAGGYGGRDGGNAGRVGGDYGGRGSGYRGGRDGGNAGRGGGDYGGRSGSGYRGGRGGGDYGGRSGGGYEGRRGGGRGRGRGGQAWTPPADLRTMRDDDWENARQSLEANLKSLELSPSKNAEPRFPTRPGPGTLGLPSRIKTNHFHVEYSFLGDLHHYHVTIDPTIPSKKLNKDLMIALVNTNNNDFGNLTPAYDGSKGLYTAGKLQFESKEFDVKLVDDRSVRERSFKVTIKYANLVDHGLLQELLAGTQSESPQEIIQCFDVVLRSAQELKDYVRVGRSLFSRQGDGYLAEGMDYSKGFYQSLRFTQMGLSLNIDTSARIFYRAGGIIDFIEHNFGRGALSQENITKASKALKGVTIIFTHREPRKQYKILGLSTQSSNHLMFTLPDGTQESVSGYFEKKYKRKLEYPYLPCLEVGSRKHPICLPMEVCEIVEGQKYVKKLSHSLVAELLKKTAVPPSTRAADIVWRVQQNDYNEDDLVKQFGFSVNNEFTSVDARVLPPPKILYDGPIPAATVDPSVGQWSMSNQRFHEGATLKFWSFISFSSIVVDRAMTEFRNKLLFELRRKGMVVENPLIERWVLHNDVKRALQDILSESLKEIYNLSRERRQLQLLVIILPDPPGYYGTIKRICEAELGIVSQCLQAEKALTAKRPYMENIALKINVKTGGRNSVLLDAYNEKIPLVTEERTIIFGADVTHPEPGVDSGPSVAAVVASMDWPYIAKYKALVSAQPHRKESIHGLSTMVKELLVSFQQSNGGDLPRKIIFYRDGVSEGEFSNVLLHEVTAIRSAYESLGKTYRPSVTFIVVQKRHHTRLFSDDPQQVDSSSNVLPGTVVDSKICHPSQYDFYLCSHAGIKGTVKPAHYHVLYDENSFTPDLLQLFTNSLCYTYARCTRSVSIVPPVYYAHLAAFRARFYVQQGEGDEVVQPLPEISENVKNVMYFC